MVKPRIFKILHFILKDSRFNLQDRLEYLTYLISLLTGILLVGYTLWTNLNINYLGLTILSILFLKGPSLYQKFIVPYYESLGNKEAREKIKDAQYSQAFSKAIMVAGAKTEFFSWVSSVVFIVLILLPALFLLKRLSLTFVGVYVLAGFLLWIITSILAWKKIWKPVSQIEVLAPKRFRKPFLFKFLQLTVILVATASFTFWRYQQITGKGFFESQLGRRSYINNLPKDKYLLIQQTKFTNIGINLGRDTIVSSGTFNLNLQNGFLNLKFPEEIYTKKRKIILFDSPKSIIFIRIRDNEVGQKFNTGKYSINSITKLPVYLDTSASSYFSPRIVGVEANGSLLIEREVFDPKVAKIYGQKGKVKETIKLPVNQSFSYITEDNHQMKLLNLGLFSKNKIFFTKSSVPVKPTLKLRSSPPFYK